MSIPIITSPVAAIPPTAAGLMASITEYLTGFYVQGPFDGAVLAQWQTPHDFQADRTFPVTSRDSGVTHRVWIRGGNAHATEFYAEVELWDEEAPNTEGWTEMTLTPFIREGEQLIFFAPGGWPNMAPE